MVARLCIIIALILVAGVLFAVSHVWHLSPASQIAPIRSADDPATIAFQTEVEQTYETKTVYDMEALAETLRRDESRVSGGNTRLFELYNVLTSIHCGCRDGAPVFHPFEDRRARLEEWLKQYPHSITANLAMTALWTYRSWQIAHGYDADDSPVPEGDRQQAFLDAQQTAASYVDKLKVTDDPYVAFFTLLLRRDSDATRDEATRLFEASTAAWPKHYQIYFLYFQILDSNFGDQQGRFQLLHDLAAAKDDLDRQVGLAFIAGARYRGGRFDGVGVDWEDVKHAYEVRRVLYGWRNRDLNVLCYLAIQAEDWAAAQDYMRQINGHWDDIVWKSQNDFVWNELIVFLH